ncbi:helix-turn-helix transcriptional regulator [Herbaspirillum huttiense F1]|uniref:helix-turn-helix domain-containing protein n=1 Tax=Herbaspirillum huttiense TaxID=863372 RepID=UPI0028874013|nr:helix-turn-helix transcriptional regulator [Herbaspirillum huttiense]MDT0358624.1 helix-turn-helix transcriptional regulator [Herbaspirillum huttiense F1]
MKKTQNHKLPVSAAKSLGQNIAALRKVSSLTQHQLASALGVEVETISRFENGRLNTSLDQVDALAAFFNVPVWTLFAPVDQKTNFPDSILITKMRALSPKHRTTLQDLIQVYCNAHRGVSKSN